MLYSPLFLFVSLQVFCRFFSLIHSEGWNATAGTLVRWPLRFLDGFRLTFLDQLYFLTQLYYSSNFYLYTTDFLLLLPPQVAPSPLPEPITQDVNPHHQKSTKILPPHTTYDALFVTYTDQLLHIMSRQVNASHLARTS